MQQYNQIVQKCFTVTITKLQYYNITKKDRKEHNPNELQIPNHPFRTLLTGNSRSELFNLISHQPDIDKIYLYSENPYKGKPSSQLANVKVQA